MSTGMEDGGVDRTVIDCWQNQLGQMADFSSPLTFLNFNVYKIKSQTMRHTQMNLVNTTLFEKYLDP